ncbi:transcriptional modulator of MazE/toxin, MazF [hydrothermal vent metagenome]|uniref:Transcriptional modulator of MazE/toxin, MazF n=1 Tax=hydrothermal vent metagenome TaxID=652676 RepID=A0A3B1DL46_9ZZZZ
MKKFQCAQIWLVNFDPSFGHEYKKVRPALIIQSNKYITTFPLLTIIPISSQVNKKADIDIFLSKDDQNRLMLNSLIKIKQISSFDERRFLRLIGVANDNVMRKVKSNIQDFLVGDF